MHKTEKPISASDINRFVYCNYQWYYEKKYGSKYLNELHKQRNRGYTDSGKSNFARGNKFHAGYVRRDRLNRLLRVVKLLAYLAIAAVVFYFLFCKKLF
jgi:hypothetical protein